jgi:hypothetical protein
VRNNRFRAALTIKMRRNATVIERKTAFCSFGGSSGADVPLAASSLVGHGEGRLTGRLIHIRTAPVGDGALHKKAT